MFTPDTLRELFTHMEWADASVWNAVLASDAARSDEQLLDRLRHIHRTQQFFLKVWRSEELDFSVVKMKDPVNDLLATVRTYYAEVSPLLDELTDQSLTNVVRIPWADRFAPPGQQAAPVTFAESLFQVTAHSTYHRGQVNSRLRAVGGEPPLVDYIAWIWFGRPAPKWAASA